MRKLTGRKVRVVNHELPEMRGMVGEIRQVNDPTYNIFPISVVFEDGEYEIFKPFELRYLNNHRVRI